MRKPAGTLNYDAVTVFGEPALFMDHRIDRSTVPPGLHMYELRHEDDDWSVPCQIARGIFVNFFGTILCAEPIPLDEDGYRDLDRGELIYTAYNTASISKYLSEYASEQAS